MDARSESNLAQVHPDLCAVIRRTAEISAQPFIVIAGIRTVEAEKANCASGASQTMHSRHLPNAQGLACAVDVMATQGSAADWDATSYAIINVAVQQAASELGHTVEWGGDWATLKDWGHFQLPWAAYP